MENRYSLCFESGERTGETIPVPASGLVVGRQPGCSLQIPESSVSGRHAELLVEPRGVLLKDLGSTNGTRVGEARILETRLAHGDKIAFGNVLLRFVDSELAESGGTASAPGAGVELEEARAASPAVTAAPASVAEAEGASVVSRIGLERLTRPGKGSAIVLVGILLAAGAVFAYLRMGAGGPVGARGRAVDSPAGNLLADSYSFEEESVSWEAQENAPVDFSADASARFSGEQGVLADLSSGEWALHRSPAARVSPGRRLVVSARIETLDGAEGRLGIELSGTEAQDTTLPALRAFGPPVGAGAFEEASLECAVPPGYRRARVLLWGGAPQADGQVSVDDVSLLAESSGSAAQAAFAEARLFLLANRGVLTKVDRVLISDLGLRPAGALHSAQAVGLSAETGESGIAITLENAGASGVLSLRAEAALFGDGLATLGENGYQPRNLEFGPESVDSVLMGAGGDLVRLAFEQPCSVRGRPEGQAFRLEIELGSQSRVELQLGFQSERAAAINLAQKARNAERQKELGLSLKLWSELLDSFPYEANLVQEAETARSRLLQVGLSEVRQVRVEVERARFFRLVDLYRECRDDARSVAARYAGSEVEAEAVALVDEAEAELAVLEVDLKRDERQRLQGILEVLEAAESPGLAGEVRTYLEQSFPPEGP